MKDATPMLLMASYWMYVAFLATMSIVLVLHALIDWKD
jgi:hypothetical protein